MRTDAAHILEQTSNVVLTAELRDTYGIYGLPEDSVIVWLSEDQFSGLPRSQRAALVRFQRTVGREVVPTVTSWRAILGELAREQAEGHRFVWWPSLLRGYEELVLSDFVESRRGASRHDRVSQSTWEAAASIVPDAAWLAGIFAPGSGPNCFGTVMAAAGVEGAETQWMLREPFDEWLSQHSRPGGDDRDAGTELIWRSVDGLPQHAAIALGQGWVLNKQCQGWMSPRSVLTARECIASSRVAGQRLERRSLVR